MAASKFNDVCGGGGVGGRGGEAWREGRRGTGSEDKVRSWILLQGCGEMPKGVKIKTFAFYKQVLLRTS